MIKPIHPKTSVSLDGAITIIVEGGPLRPYEFSIKKIAPVAGVQSAWTGSDTPNGRDKTYTGLTAGTYKIYVDVDNASGDPHTCIITEQVDLIATCEDACGDGGAGGSCTNALEVAEKTGLSATNLPEHVKFNHISQYNIGESDITLSMWVKPETNNSNMQLFSWDNGYDFRLGADPGTEPPVTPPALPGSRDAIQFILSIFGANKTGNGATTLGNPYPGQNGAAISVNFSYHTDSDFGAGGTAYKFVSDPIASWDPDNLNHIVAVIREVPATQVGTGVTLTGANAPLVGATATAANADDVLGSVIDFWVNGVQVTGAWNIAYNAQIPTSTLTPTERDYVRNFDNYTGAMRLFGRVSAYDSGGGVGTSATAAPTAGEVTNFQIYKRSLTGTEIQHNYMEGCHGYPVNCASLILYAPLDQTTGKVTPEHIYGNNGQLIGYASNRTNVIGGTSAWIEACCGKIVSWDDYTCGAQDCNPDFVEFHMTLGGTAAPGETVVAALIPLIGSCPTPATVATQATFESISTLFELTGIDSALELVDEFVLAFNTAFAGTGITASDNLTTIIIRIPKDYAGSQGYCNQPFSLCLYSGTDETPVTYAGGYTVSYPKGQMANCCVPATDCGLNNDAPIMI